jgi:phospholipase/lecithinase/hemolysin
MLAALRHQSVRLGALLALSLAASATVEAQRSFSSLTMFGDSFSDVGNASALTGGAVPSRISNGLVWSDYLGARLGLTSDVRPAFVSRTPTGVYAVAGALTGTTATGTGTQIGLWCGFNGTTCTRAADPTGLYTLFAGGNDVRAAAGLATDGARRAATVAAAQNLLTQGGSLTQLGARNILFAYLPDLGLTPDRITTPQSATLTSLTQLFNATLQAGIGQLRLAAPTANLFDLRLDNLFTNLLTEPAAFGFSNTNGSCAAAGALPTCAGYVFFDGLHPTTAAHGVVGAAAYNLVAFDRNVAVVPEPATVVLMGTGLLVLAGVARRRQGR